MINDALYIVPNENLAGTSSTRSGSYVSSSRNSSTTASTSTTSSRSGSNSSSKRSSSTPASTAASTKTYKCADGTILTLAADVYEKRNNEYNFLRGKANYFRVELPNRDNVMRGNGYPEQLKQQALIDAKNKATQAAKDKAEQAAKDKAEQAAKDKAAAESIAKAASNTTTYANTSASNVNAETPESNGGWWKWLLGGAGVIGLYFMFKPKKRKRK